MAWHGGWTSGIIRWLQHVDQDAIHSSLPEVLSRVILSGTECDGGHSPCSFSCLAETGLLVRYVIRVTYVTYVTFATYLFCTGLPCRSR
jgi:hypothetical protein